MAEPQTLRFVWPRPLGIATGLLTVATFAGAANPLATGNLVSHVVPPLGRFLAAHVRKLLVGLLAAHFAEYVLALRPRLAKFHVTPVVHLQWFVAQLFVGFPQYQLLD